MKKDDERLKRYLRWKVKKEDKEDERGNGGHGRVKKKLKNQRQGKRKHSWD